MNAVFLSAALILVAVLLTLFITSQTWSRRRLEYEKKIASLESALAFKDEQMESSRMRFESESEKVLRRRQEELDRRAEEHFEHIAGTLGRDFKEMKDAFEKNKQAQTETSSSLRANIEFAVRSLAEQTGTLSEKAENLADALRGRNKMQGCWGETILENIFRQEGMLQGRDYDAQSTLKDDSGANLRPDFILHFPDDTDVVVDSKVSLSALSDWYAAESEEQKEDALRRNLDSVKSHIKELAAKDYSRYLASGRKSIDYVVMFIPNYASLQLARSLEPDIFVEAFKKNVLVTTEETIMPFLRMLRTAWVNVEQIRNQQQIISAAQTMIDRVHDFTVCYAAVGKKLEEAAREYEKGDLKLRDGGMSIITSARQVIKLGVPENPKKQIG